MKLFKLKLFYLFHLLPLLTLFPLLFVACAPVYKANIDYAMSEGILWPGQPEKPRIKYLWSLYSLAPRMSFVDFLAGGGDPTDPKASRALVMPYSVYFEGERLYVADSGAMRATVINIKTMEVLQLGISGKGELGFPVGIVADKAGNIYVSDSDLNKIFVYDKDGKFTGNLSEVKFVRPAGLAYDKDKDLIYVVDALDHKVYGISPANGSVRLIIGKRGDGDGEFNYPTHITVDKDGRIWVTDTLNFRIQGFDRQGKFSSKFGSAGDSYDKFALPKGVAADSEGNIYVVDSSKDTVKIFNGDGRLLLPFGEEGGDRGMFWLPAGIFIDKDDKIYIADTYNRRVQVFQFLGGK
ncbi:MAG: NHL repeat-containing protein [Nitrospirae bacterium]|nr:MAG: NHL repeat-containing protein [Nitrospirota bacterium]